MRIHMVGGSAGQLTLATALDVVAVSHVARVRRMHLRLPTIALFRVPGASSQ